MADDKVFLGVVRIDGVMFMAKTLTSDKVNARSNFCRLWGMRNARLVEEHAQIVAVYEVGDKNQGADITTDKANEMVEKLRHQKACAGQTLPEQVDSKYPNRILYEPVTPKLYY